MTDILESLASLSVLVFVVSSMLSMGLSLTTEQIIEPLSNARLVVLGLAANFLAVPILAYVITLIFPLADPIRVGLILLSTAAGAPFLPKMVQMAKGSAAFSVGFMVLLMVVTITYLPLVLPLLLGDVQVSPLVIARSLVVMMLIPLAVGLFIKAPYDEAAEGIQPTFVMAANIALLMLVVLNMTLNFDGMIALVGSLGILAGAIFMVASLGVGYLPGGSDQGIKTWERWAPHREISLRPSWSQRRTLAPRS